MIKAAIIDTELGNLLSVKNAFLKFCPNVEITRDKTFINSASHLIIPGVGSFKEGIKKLKNYNLITTIKENFNDQKPIMGICLGLQLLFSTSEEHGLHEGLNFIEGRVIKIPISKNYKVPVIGWKKTVNNIFFKDNFCNNKNFYFDHSYMAIPNDKSLIKSYYVIGDINVPSFIKKKNFYGFQFHPEKSGHDGLKIVDQFLKL